MLGLRRPQWSVSVGVDLLFDVEDVVLGSLDDPHDRRVGLLLSLARSLPDLVLTGHGLAVRRWSLGPCGLGASELPRSLLVLSDPTLLLEPLLLLPLLLLPFGLLDLTLGLLPLSERRCLLLVLPFDLLEACLLRALLDLLCLHLSLLLPRLFLLLSAGQVLLLDLT